MMGGGGACAALVLPINIKILDGYGDSVVAVCDRPLCSSGYSAVACIFHNPAPNPFPPPGAANPKC
jgi:hypothetical protein